MRAEVVVDARWLETGLGRYTFDLLAGLRRHRDGLVVRVITRGQHVTRLEPYCDKLSIVDVPIYTLREQLRILWAARGADLLHVPHYNAPLLYPGKLVVTIHDVIHIVDPTYARSPAGRLYAFPMLNLVARKARHIITVSRYSKAQIVERLCIAPSKVTVIYSGVDAPFGCLGLEEARRKVSRFVPVPRPYVLYVGNLKPHKNVVSLIRAFALLRERGLKDPQLVIVGDDPRWKGELLAEISNLKVEEHVSFLSNLSGDLMPHLYTSAELLVLPSFVEGFGLPVLEAMACGTPVVCSRAASLPEVAGDAAEYFDPASVEALAAAIERVLGSRELQGVLRRKGLERARQFSWDESARRHCEVYRKVLEG